MAGLFSSATLEQIRAASDIVDVIGSYVPLKRAGANFVALCPFHKEKSPSFNVHPQRQIFHCFGCHKGGDVFTFVREYENIGFAEAVRRLAERARIPLETEVEPHQKQHREVKERLLLLHEQITQRWQNSLSHEAGGQIARDYLARRGVSAEAVALFRLGYAPELWDDTVNWAKSKGYELELVERAGLIVRKDNSDRHYDRFRGRLMFPICDEQGRVIGFSGRILSGDEKTAKYVNSPETPLFTKGKVIFGLDKSKRALLDARSAIVCEGQLDLIACFMAGVKNVVAPQGTALTADHARILKRYVEEVVLCFDSDTAGQAAAVRSLDDLLATGLAVRVATVPAPHDPDSFIKERGGPAFAQLIQGAPGFFDFYLDHLCVKHDAASDKGRLTIVKEMAGAVVKTQSSVLLDNYAQKTALRLGVSPDAARTEFKKVAKSNSRHADVELDADSSPAAPDERPSQQEFWLLKLALLPPETATASLPPLQLDWISHPLVRRVIDWKLKHPDAAPLQVLAELEDPAAASLITEALAEDRKIPNPAQQLNDLLLRLRNQFIDRQLASLTARAAQPAWSESERNELLRQRMELTQLKRRPLAET